MYILRLDDASEFRDVEKWQRMENLLDKYGVRPIFGIIPDCKDPELLVYPKDELFWEAVNRWIEKGWTPAMHGYQHLFKTKNGGINPVNNYSEFAGVPYEEQCEMIRSGYDIIKQHDIDAKIFFAPAHTFDNNTLKSLKEKTDIRIISDTVANDVYFCDGIYYIPQQSGCVRKLSLKTVTFCYHPNSMNDNDFKVLENFIAKNANQFEFCNYRILKKRKKSLYDRLLQLAYRMRKFKKVIKRT